MLVRSRRHASGLLPAPSVVDLDVQSDSLSAVSPLPSPAEASLSEQLSLLVDIARESEV